MFNYGNALSAADVAAVTDRYGRNNDGAWGNDWWAVIIILALYRILIPVKIYLPSIS